MSAPEAARPRRWLFILPLVIFSFLAGIFLLQLLSGRDISVIPSALIGTQAPETDLPPLEGSGLPTFDMSTLKGEVVLVNVWASWCVPCRAEHPFLMELASDDRFVLAGLNYKDQPQNALRFLGELGNPFDMIGVDQRGRGAINWGIYGVPETFLVGRDGTIVWKHVGPFTAESVRDELMPRLEKALAPDGTS